MSEEKDLETSEVEVKGKEEKKRSALSYAIEFAIYIALILICVFWVPEYVIQRTVVSGESMESTLHDGESLLVEKVSYRFSNPDRYDIIVFEPPEEEKDEPDELYVKRIFGLPGEKIRIDGENIYVDGKIIEDGYAKNTMDDPGIAEQEITLGDDEYFVLGDNRRVSKDSRDIGPIKKDSIRGHVVLRIWPLGKFGIPK